MEVVPVATTRTRTPREAAGKTPTKKTPARSATARKVTYVPSEAEIRERAYQIFLNRGAQPGRELDDWLQAERELKERVFA